MYASRNQHQQQHQVQQDASYPVMPVSDICDCLAALNVPVNPEDLHKPTPLSAQHIYAGLVNELMGVPLDMIEGPKQSLMGMMEYKDLYGEALQFTMFFKHVRRLADICGCKNFTMADMTRPDSQRLKHNLSGIINFAKFRDDRSEFHHQLQEQTRQQVEKVERLRKQLGKIEGAIEDITAKSAADRPKTEEATNKNAELRAELLELRNLQMRLSHEVEELKKERMTFNDQATGRVNDLNQLNVQISSARSRLVQSPDRIKKHISEMSHGVSADKNTLGTFQRKARELGKRVEIFHSLEMDLKGLIDLEKGIEDQRAKVEEARRSMLTLRARLEGKNIESQGLTTKLSQLERQLINAADRQKRSEDMTKEVRERADAKMEALKEEYVERRKERNQWDKQKEALQSELNELLAEEKAWITKHEGELNEMLEEYWTMRKQTEDYISTMSVKLGLRLDKRV